MKTILNWFDHRTGFREMVRGALWEHIPGGSRWRYVWGSTLVFAFLTQAVTGIFLWMAYSPSSQTAWESVYYIQHEMAGGWLLRGIHHYMAQVMIVLLALHVMQVVIDGAYRAPREVNFWIGILLLLVTLGLSLTGYLLPWDQKGYWATKVATNIAGTTPVVGPQLQQLIIGGSEYGHHTLTRFFAMHAGLLPAAFVLFLVIHVYVFRRHGIHPKKPNPQLDAHFWPDQVLKDAVACLAVLAVVLFLVFMPWITGGFSADAHLGAQLGAHLGPPAEATEEFQARPEWYFLSLFQLLKYVPEHVGAFIVPGVAMFILFLMPLVGRWRLGHWFNVAFTFVLLGGAIGLTAAALVQDSRSGAYQASVAHVDNEARRLAVLVHANEGIPPVGAGALMREDPAIMGPRIFRDHCAKCHRYDGHDGAGAVPQDRVTGEPIPATAADLGIHGGFASRQWIEHLLQAEHIASPDYFGGTKFAKGKMVEFVNKRLSEMDQEDVKKGTLALSAQAKLKHQREADERDADIIKEGNDLIDLKLSCTDCHQWLFFDDPAATAPTLAGYGSRDWLIKFISDPAADGKGGHPLFYGDKNAMPRYGAERILSPREIELVVDWLRGEYYDPADPEATWPWKPWSVRMAELEKARRQQEQDAPPDAAPDAAPDAPTTDANPDSPAPPTTVDPLAKPDRPASPFDPDPDPAPQPPAPAPADAPAPPVTPVAVPDRIDFVAHIKPIFEQHCVSCHGPTRPKGKFSLHTALAAFTPGASKKAAIFPGKSDESLLIELVTDPDPELRMPPGDDGDPLTPVQIAIVRKWIDAGAQWPEGVELQAPSP